MMKTSDIKGTDDLYYFLLVDINVEFFVMKFYIDIFRIFRLNHIFFQFNDRYFILTDIFWLKCLTI